jgi:hypothetical protein
VRLVYGVLHGLIFPGLARGWDLGPAGCTHASAGPLSYELMTDALEAGQEALSIWDAAGDRFRSSENYRWLSRLHWSAGHRDLAFGTYMARGTEAWRHGPA